MNKQTLAPVRPNNDAPFEEFLQYYLDRKGWSQNKLAYYSRLNQSHVNKLFKGKIANPSVDMIICICLALQIDVESSIDLLARAERAFSPASKLHRAYLELIAHYSERHFETNPDSNWMEEADKYLKERCLSPLMNNLGY